MRAYSSRHRGSSARRLLRAPVGVASSTKSECIENSASAMPDTCSPLGSTSTTSKGLSGASPTGLSSTRTKVSSRLSKLNSDILMTLAAVFSACIFLLFVVYSAGFTSSNAWKSVTGTIQQYFVTGSRLSAPTRTIPGEGSSTSTSTMEGSPAKQVCDTVSACTCDTVNACASPREVGGVTRESVPQVRP